MDYADDAQRAEERHRETALERQARAPAEAPEIDEEGNRRCLDCDVIIPPKRVELINAVRCVHCQSRREHWQRTTGRVPGGVS